MFASTPQREAPSLEVLHLCCSQLQPSTSSLGRFYSELVIVHSSGRWHCVDFLNCWLQELQLMQLSMNASRVVGGLWHCCNCHHNIQLPAFQLTRLVYSFHFAAACKSARVSNLQQDTRPTVHPGNLCRAATRSRQAQCVWRPRSRCPAEPGCHRSHRGRCRCKRCPRNVYPGERCCSWMHCGRTTLLPKRDRRWQVASWMLPVQAAFLHLPSRCSEKRLLDASWMLPVQAGFFYRRPRRSEKRLLDAAWMLLVQAGSFIVVHAAARSGCWTQPGCCRCKRGSCIVVHAAARSGCWTNRGCCRCERRPWGVVHPPVLVQAASWQPSPQIQKVQQHTLRTLQVSMQSAGQFSLRIRQVVQSCI